VGGSARRPDREPHPAGYAVGVDLAESQPRRAGGEQPAEPGQDEVRCHLVRMGAGPATRRLAGSERQGRWLREEAGCCGAFCVHARC